MPWCIGGDFNVFRLPIECSNDRRMSPAMWEFSDFISERSLLDLSLSEGNFASPIAQESPSIFRLDKFLISAD